MASNYYYPTSKNGIQKTLAAQLLNTASTGDAITFSDVDGVENKPGVLVINRVDANGADTPSAREFISYSGTSGNTVLIETRNVDGSGATRTHAVNSIVEFVADGVWGQRVIDQALVAHNVDGTHKSGSVLTLPQINDTSADHQYILGVSELTADRTITLPLLTGNDDFVFEDHTQTLTNKTLTAPVLGGTVTGTYTLGGTPTLTSPTIQGLVDGWTLSTDTWTYASASTFTIAGVDRTAVFTAGTRLKFTQTTVKYAVVVSSSFSTNTTVTIAVNTDYTIANAAITLPYYSYAASPQGYPGYFSWTPTLTNLTIGNGTITAEYAQFGTTAHFYFNVTFGNTTSMGTNPIFTLPVTPKYTNSINGASICLDSGTASYFSHSVNESVGSKENVYNYAVATSGAYSTYNLIASTVPFTWTTNDRLSVTGTYEIA